MAETLPGSGQVIDGRYRLDIPIGQGGFSTVYRGEHLEMNRTVAIKIFGSGPVDPTATQQRAARFVEEARMVSRLTHPNTVTIHDFGIDDGGTAFLVMEFIEGPTLGEVIIEESPLSRQRVIAIFLQILGSLEEAHHHRILHCDIKPANIMLHRNFKGEDVIKVLDFGIARMLQVRPGDDEYDGVRNCFMGTPRFAAPEQLLGEELSLATDVYAVGALLWTCLTGRPMIADRSFDVCLEKAVDSRPWKLPTDAGLDNDLTAIIERAVRKRPDERFQDAQAMRNALLECTTMDENSLPKPRTSPFDTESAKTVDPNLDGDDEENYFLNPDAAPPPESARQQPERPPRPIGAEHEPLELDLPDSSGGGHEPLEIEDNIAGSWTPENSHSTGRNDDSHTPQDERDSLAGLLFRPQILIGAVAFVVAAVVAVAIVFTLVGDSAPSPADPDATATAEAESDDPPPVSSLAERSRFSPEGIATAIRTQGWRIDEFREPIEFNRYIYRPMTVYRGDVRLEVILLEAHDDEIRAQLEADTDASDERVTLDHIVVRIRPRDEIDRNSAIAIRQFLEEFRNLADE